MALSVGIVGLPNVGKSTIFKALTKKPVDIQNYPFCTIEPNVGVVEVPDERLAQLAAVSQSAKIIPAVIQFIDIAGLVAGAHEGEGLGNQFLANIRECDIILQVVRAFSDPDIIHVTGEPKPADDIETINLELIFKDLETLQNHAVKVEKKVKGRERDAEIELALVNKLLAMLSEGQPAKNYQPLDNEKIFLRNLDLLSAKPTLYIINCSSEKPTLGYPAQCQPALEIDIKLENELSELPTKEARELRQNLPHPKHNLDDLITACYALLKLESFFTTGEDETRAWTIKKGSRASEAAGKIHTDFEKGFIRADVIFWQDLISAGSWHEAREKGLMRTEGKEYLVRDGDVMIFKFN